MNGYLARIVRGVSDAETKILGSQETIEFRQAVKGQRHPRPFLASSMATEDWEHFSLPDHSRSFLADARYGFEPTGGLWRKSSVYGLNGQRMYFVMDLSLVTYEHAI